MNFVRPEEIIKNLGLEPGMVAADFGAGSGHYSIEAAKIVRNSGKVYAIDVQKELLDKIKSLAEANNLSNIEIVWSDLEKNQGSRLADGMIDAVIISNILFQAEDKNAVVKEASRILKKGGKVMVVEWDKDSGSGKAGPPSDRRVSRNECENFFKNAGFNLQKEFPAGENHYGQIFIKSR